MFHQINHGKLGITLNAKEPRAVDLLKRLAAESDVVIENMSPGAMDRAGLGYEALRAVNPRIVYLSMAAAGQFGPLAQMRTYAPVMSSFVGLEALIGYRNEAPIGSLNFAIGDPNASVHGLVALLAALLHARRTGVGCYIDLSQIEAMLATLGPYMLNAQVTGRPARAARQRASRHGAARHLSCEGCGHVAHPRRAGRSPVDGARLARRSSRGRRTRDSRRRQDASRIVDELDPRCARGPRRSTAMRSSRKLRSGGHRRLAGADDPRAMERRQLRRTRGEEARRDSVLRRRRPVQGALALFRHDAGDRSAAGPRWASTTGEVFCDMLGLSEAEFAELKDGGVIA